MYFYCFWLKHSLKGDLTSNIMHLFKLTKDFKKKTWKMQCSVLSSSISLLIEEKYTLYTHLNFCMPTKLLTSGY